MSSLTHLETRKLERALKMEGGSVLDFTNRTFETFFQQVVGIRIYSSKFDHHSGSKANRMRKFWSDASDVEVQTALIGLIDGWDFYSPRHSLTPQTRELFQEIIARLGGRRSAKGAAR